jgi:23S rRNA pseudouridine1911/1915/1917 synthase
VKEKDLERHIFTAGPSDKDKRIDLFLREKLSIGGEVTVTRSQIQKLIEEGHVMLLTAQGLRPLKPSYKLKPDDEISVTIQEKPSSPVTLPPQAIPIKILYKDEHICVVDKPPGMVVYPGPGHHDYTLINALMYHVNLSQKLPGGPLRPGIVHRLDKDTSGVMVIALSERAYYNLVEIFKKREIKRRYLCLACGEFFKDEGVIDLPIGRASSDRKKFSTRTRAGKEAVTHWRVIERFRGATLLEVFLRTGRTHQIRVHLASIGHPVCGDSTYGRKTFIEMKGKGIPLVAKVTVELTYITFRGGKLIFPRQMLHAETLGFRHPVTGEELEFSSAMPPDMKEAIETLKQIQ